MSAARGLLTGMAPSLPYFLLFFRRLNSAWTPNTNSSPLHLPCRRADANLACDQLLRACSPLRPGSRSSSPAAPRALPSTFPYFPSLSLFRAFRLPAPRALLHAHPCGSLPIRPYRKWQSFLRPSPSFSFLPPPSLPLLHRAGRTFRATLSRALRCSIMSRAWSASTLPPLPPLRLPGCLLLSDVACALHFCCTAWSIVIGSVAFLPNPTLLHPSYVPCSVRCLTARSQHVLASLKSKASVEPAVPKIDALRQATSLVQHVRNAAHAHIRLPPPPSPRGPGPVGQP